MSELSGCPERSSLHTKGHCAVFYFVHLFTFLQDTGTLISVKQGFSQLELYLDLPTLQLYYPAAKRTLSHTPLSSQYLPSSPGILRLVSAALTAWISTHLLCRIALNIALTGQVSFPDTLSHAQVLKSTFTGNESGSPPKAFSFV